MRDPKLRATQDPVAPQQALQDPARRPLLLGALAAGAGSLLPWQLAGAQTMDKSTLAIAYPADVPTWDPNALSIPIIQNLYQSVFDSPLRYSPQLKLEPRQVKEWKWQGDKATRLEITLRDDILFHDGTRMTMDDVRYSLAERARADKKLLVGGMLNTLSDIEVKSPTKGVMVFNRPTPAAPIYLAFLAAYVAPKAYMEKVGPEGFNAKPIGAGPYRMVEHQRGSRIVLEAFDKYWGGALPIKQAIFQIVPEGSARVALVESGRVGLATQLPMREVQRLASKSGVTTKIYPVSEVYMIRIPNYVKPMDNDHVRAAMHLAIDKAALSKAFYAGVAKPLSVMTPEGTPSYVADFHFPFDKAKAIEQLTAAGFGTSNPVSFTFLTTNGVFPNDYDMARAIVGMWKQVGINATIEETTPAKLVEAAQNGKLAGPLLYNWVNSTGDPENYAGRIFDPRLRFSAWKDMSLAPRIDALMTEVDEARRMAGYKALNVESSQQSWAIPLLQAVSTVAYSSALQPTLFDNGYILPADMKYR
ncbi:peptide/nickel transport system substrate-binding protein [Variovorax sp. HW608]|uniref:ABC transporter substrate-binding protein n=1 Tax=Variovorax sp. HW608 TaxID=1034889 RepID=UPI00081FFE51|nr:ABC transporter substrate-binding protein [Variovorax sp. HW608]SCK12556.1 peptide/nickel transport system substrate-binding protein [Variovorax sp. HW608]